MEYRRYFAYGSNMLFARLRVRVPSARAVGVYILPAHDLRFHKRSDKDGSGKCDAFYTGDDGDEVIGRLFYIARADEKKLDAAEGLGVGYGKKTVALHDANGKTETAFTYYATDIDDSIRPFTWYKQHVLAGAREAALPGDYIAKIAAVAADKDSDRERAEREMGLHRGGDE